MESRRDVFLKTKYREDKNISIVISSGSLNHICCLISILKVNIKDYVTPTKRDEHNAFRLKHEAGEGFWVEIIVLESYYKKVVAQIKELFENNLLINIKEKENEMIRTEIV